MITPFGWNRSLSFTFPWLGIEMSATATRTEPVRLADGRALRMTIAEPPAVIRGGLVVLHEERDTDAVRALIDALAAEGWLVVAPHVDVSSALADVDIAFGFLAQHGIGADMIGVVGFELGGAVAMVVAARRGIGAAVSVSAGGALAPRAPGLPAMVEVAGELRCPWLGLYGDTHAEEVERLRWAAARSVTATDVVVFPATDHRFDLHPDAAFEAWQRMLNWFDAHLR